jgi:hypothetical protein
MNGLEEDLELAYGNNERKLKQNLLILRSSVFQNIKPGNMLTPERVTGGYLIVQY